MGDLHTPAIEGSTPLDPDEAEGLIPDHITTREELNAWERANILRAEQWAFARRRPTVLSIRFVIELHRRMFDETWEWAGSFRRSDKNLGVPWPVITEHVGDLIKNTTYWLQHGTFGIDEAAARFHHQLVAIHPFPNGNGRHSRLITDVLLRSRGQSVFTWGVDDLLAPGATRASYISALKSADKGDLKPLISFARS